MIARTFRIDTPTYTKVYERISKAAARKMFYKGGAVHILSVNMRPGNYSWPFMAQKDREICSRSFNSLCNNYEYYNCDNIRGYYPAFYTERIIPKV